jgi:hypothetical protein
MKTYEVNVYPNGHQEWVINGKYHRDDGPAIIDSDGTQYWYKDGNLHREDGPAYIRPDGTQAWFKDGNRHRDDGPAIIWQDGSQSWFKDGKQYTQKEFDKQTKTCDGKVVEIDGVKYKLTLA